MKHLEFSQSTGFGSVRSANQRDIADILRLAGQLATFHGDTPTLAAADVQRDLFGTPPWLHVLVADCADEVVGYAALFGCAQFQFGARGMDLHHLVVDEHHRSRKIGHALVAAATAYARGLSSSYLPVGTHPDNHAAQAFYERLGFMRCDAHPPRFTIRLNG